MTRQTLASLLAMAAAVLAAVASLAGLLWVDPVAPSGVFTSVHGETVVLFGHGPYRFDTLLLGAGFLGQDLVTLFLAVPAMLFVAWRDLRDRSMLWTVSRLALISYFAYVYGTLALGAFYNPLFLLYIATFSASTFGIAVSASVFHARLHPDWIAIAGSVPRIGPATFLVVAGAFTAFIWLQPLVAALLAGTPPPLLGHATTKVTDALDLAIVVPSSICAAILMLRGRLAGYVLAVPLLGIIVMLFPVITASTLSQLAAGVAFTAPEIAGPIGGFLLFGAWGGLTLWRLSISLQNADATRVDEQGLKEKAA